MELQPPNCEECPWEVCNGIDRHHTYYPRAEYKTRIEKQFRNLGENVVRVCINDHREFHATNEPPQKPTRDEMLRAINGA